MTCEDRSDNGALYDRPALTRVLYMYNHLLFANVGKDMSPASDMALDLRAACYADQLASCFPKSVPASGPAVVSQRVCVCGAKNIQRDIVPHM